MKLTKINPEYELRKMENAKKSKKSVQPNSYEVKHIIIDCSCMNYMDSMGINTLLKVKKFFIFYQNFR
jgi:anti-anti-sigma regulatory factor